MDIDCNFKCSTRMSHLLPFLMIYSQDLTLSQIHYGFILETTVLL